MKDMTDKRDILKEQLTENNRIYFGALENRLHEFNMPSEQKVEEMLLEILDHLLEGQKDGKAAEKMFQSNPQDYADELIKSIPKKSVRSMLENFIFLGPFVFGMMFLYQSSLGFLHYFFPQIDDSFKLAKNISTVVIIFIAIFIISDIIKHTLRGSKVLRTLAFFVSIVIMMALRDQFEDVWALTLSPWLSLFLGVACFLTPILIAKGYERTENISSS